MRGDRILSANGMLPKSIDRIAPLFNPLTTSTPAAKKMKRSDSIECSFKRNQAPRSRSDSASSKKSLQNFGTPKSSGGSVEFLKMKASSKEFLSTMMSRKTQVRKVNRVLKRQHDYNKGMFLSTTHIYIFILVFR